MAEAEFHELTVTEVAPLTAESVAVTLDVPDALTETFRFLPGQHVTMRQIIDGEDVRRSYSICAPSQSGKLRVGIKRLPGGAFSTFANERLKAGATIEVMPPVGEFTIELDPTRRRRSVAVAAGSGITPVLSLISSSLEAEPNAMWTLIYGNRRAVSVMFLDELEGLKDRYPSRFQLVHVLSAETSELPLLSGRLDGRKVNDLRTALFGNFEVDDWYLCGPYEMIMSVEGMLSEEGVAADRVHDELFFAGPQDRSGVVVPAQLAEGSVDLTVIVNGRAVSASMDPSSSILDAALAVSPRLPFSCKGGMCATCKAKVEDGTVSMTKNYALVDSEVAEGFILSCQAHPTSDSLTVRFDHR